MKKTKWIVGILSLIVIVGAALYYISQTKNDTKNEETAEMIHQVGERAISKNNITAWGEVGYTNSQEINIDFPATVSSVEVKEGDSIKNGDVLVTLDIDEFKKNIQKMQQQILINEILLEDITQDKSAVSAEISQIKGDIAKKTKEYNEETNAELQILKTHLTRMNREIEDAKKDYEKQKKLFEAGGISEYTLENYEDVIDQKEKAKIEIENNIRKIKDALKDEINALNTGLKYKEVQLSNMVISNTVNRDKQNISINLSQLDLEIMQNKLEKTYLLDNKIISNMEKGMIKSIFVIAGSRLGTQNTAGRVLEIIDADTIVVRAEVPEEFVTQIKEGDKAEIIPKADRSESIQAIVTHISKIAVEKDGKRIVKVEAKPKEPTGLLNPGYSADVIFKLEE
ncbi:HlyD family secretion protein [Cellulosilyticum sp. I15G10I2]|uniref:HlyD family secretion protein n=1 Tax=Cellulosilyticum sp. I15G10I2 TaxID=1892843 RepID=UPI00085C1152|nr:biotin/lipoyl-binding protein [Cellulosilyticum sp. I15G10I2]